MIADEKPAFSRLPAADGGAASAVAEATTPPKNGTPAPTTTVADGSKPKKRRKRGRSRGAGTGQKPKRPFPRVPLENALSVARVLKDKNGGNPTPPADVAAALKVGPKTMKFWYLLASAQQFGLTEGT